MKKAVAAAMAVFFVLGWTITAQDMIKRPAEFKYYLEEAKAYESNRIYVKAIESYRKALEYKADSLDIKNDIARNYLALGDESGFINECNTINTNNSYPVSTSLMVIDYYIEKDMNNKAIDVMKKALKYHEGDEELKKRYAMLQYTFSEVYIRTDDLYNFRNDSAVIVNDDRYGLVNRQGKTILKAQYQWAGALSGDRNYIPVLKDGQYYFADTRGYRVEVPREGMAVEALGVLCNGVAPAKINGSYGYINEKFEELSNFQWEDATVIQNQVGAVKSNGKWAVIDSKYNQLTDYIYDDIKVDEYGYCSISSRIFAKTDKGYVMLNEKGVQVSEQIFEDAVPFLSSEPTAVKLNGRWGFADTDGNLVVEARFDNAGPFSGGLAPVQSGSSWGYINLQGEMVIEPDYLEAKSFYKGVAPVKKDSQWSAIKLNIS